MKTILVPTDFSLPALNAAEFAWHIAKQTEADLILFHAGTTTMKTPVPFQGSVTLEDLTSSPKIHGHLDMLAIVHHKTNKFKRFFKESLSEKLSGQLEIPLLVIPE